LVLIAGGIGIAPMRSIVHTLADRHDLRPVFLFHAAHDESRVAFRDELEALRQRLTLEVVYILEEPGTDRPAERGLISAELLSRRLPAEHREWHHLICGPPPMVDAVEKALRALGVRRSLIDSERFNLV
jgi:ferredoxin-NADP reductase